MAGGLNPLLIPSGIVAAVMAALDMDEYWTPYFNPNFSLGTRITA